VAFAINDRATIYVSAIAEGAALTTYAAYSRILASKAAVDLTVAQYSWVFLPELIAAIAAGLLAVRASRRTSTKLLFILGLICILTSAGVLIGSAAVLGLTGADFPLLLVSSAFLGAGFGLAFPALMTYAVVLNPRRPDVSVLVLNALMVLGAVAGPVVVFAFALGSFWWDTAVLILLTASLIAASVRLPSTGSADGAILPFDLRIPPRFKAYGILVLLFSSTAILMVAWSQPDATKPAAAPLTFKALLLGVFWAALVMAARVLFAALDRRPSLHAVGVALFVVLAASGIISLILGAYTPARICIYILAALSCAAFLPLESGPGGEQLTVTAIAFLGGIAVLYPLLLGVSRVFLMAMRQAGLSLLMIYAMIGAFGLLVSLVMLSILLRAEGVRPAPKLQ
jgi:MFS family permease